MTDVILDVSHIAKTFGHVQALKILPSLYVRAGAYFIRREWCR